ncbi:MAG: triose-phosphate isomerase [Rhodocyclaceae bacterium]|jgi:triosephosphate isomerase|nr:triose-phosphate isomerase [Rhodocyclaceae bacterium]
MRRKLVAGNWKMHGSLAGNRDLLQSLVQAPGKGGKADCAVCVPFPYLAQAQDQLKGTAIAWGAQNVSEHAQGAYTGEVSAAMLKDFGCRYVLVGHSERRSLYGESNETVAAKFVAAVMAGLTPVLCLGETLDQREGGVTEKIVAAQLDAVVEAAGLPAFANAVIAYEPVWAIGTGRTARPDQAQEVHAFIRGRIASEDAALALRLQILYGGSVKAQNAAELFGMADIDGGLIGGASLVAKDFLAICEAAAH